MCNQICKLDHIVLDVLSLVQPARLHPMLEMIVQPQTYHTTACPHAFATAISLVWPILLQFLMTKEYYFVPSAQYERPQRAILMALIIFIKPWPAFFIGRG